MTATNMCSNFGSKWSSPPPPPPPVNRADPVDFHFPATVKVLIEDI